MSPWTCEEMWSPAPSWGPYTIAALYSTFQAVTKSDRYIKNINAVELVSRLENNRRNNLRLKYCFSNERKKRQMVWRHL